MWPHCKYTGQKIQNFNSIKRKSLLIILITRFLFILCTPCFSGSKRKKSIASLSDCTDYKAAAVVTSLKEILSNLITEGKTKINIIRDSPLQGFPYWGAWGGESPPHQPKICLFLSHIEKFPFQ